MCVRLDIDHDARWRPVQLRIKPAVSARSKPTLWSSRTLASQAELALLDNDSTAIDVIVQHLASKNDKARQAAIFAISRISSFQVELPSARGARSNPDSLCLWLVSGLVCSSGAALLCPGPMCLLMTWNSKEGIVAPTYCAGKSERSAAFSATAGTHKPRGPPGCPSSTGNLRMLKSQFVLLWRRTKLRGFPSNGGHH